MNDAFHFAHTFVYEVLSYSVFDFVLQNYKKVCESQNSSFCKWHFLDFHLVNIVTFTRLLDSLKVGQWQNE